MCRCHIKLTKKEIAKRKKEDIKALFYLTLFLIGFLVIIYFVGR